MIPLFSWHFKSYECDVYGRYSQSRVCKYDTGTCITYIGCMLDGRIINTDRCINRLRTLHICPRLKGLLSLALTEISSVMKTTATKSTTSSKWSKGDYRWSCTLGTPTIKPARLPVRCSWTPYLRLAARIRVSCTLILVR